MTDFRVSPSDVRAYSALVGRQQRAAAAMHAYATTNLADAEFGRLMDLMSGDYGALLPQVHSLLENEASRLGLESDAFEAAAQSYAAMDADAAGRYDEQLAPPRSSSYALSGPNRAI